MRYADAVEAAEDHHDTAREGRRLHDPEQEPRLARLSCPDCDWYVDYYPEEDEDG